MGGPGWLADIFAALMLTVALYCAARLVAARWRRRLTELDTDAIHVVMGVAMAGMLVGPAHLVGRGLGGVFAAGAVWFGRGTLQARRGASASPWRCLHPAPHIVECAAMLYMFLLLPASPAVRGAAAGMASLSASSAASRFSFLALLMAVFLLGYVVVLGDRLSVRTPALALAKGCAGPGPPRPPPGPAMRGALQDCHGYHHGLHADHDAVATKPVTFALLPTARTSARRTWTTRMECARSALPGLAEVPAVALGIIHGVAACAVRPDPDVGHARAGGLGAIPVGRQVRDRDALQLGYLTESGGSPEVSPGGTQHDDTAVVEQELPVPDGPVAALIAHPLGEGEGPDQPVHGRAGIGIQKVGNDLRIWMVLRHGSNFTARDG